MLSKNRAVLKLTVKALRILEMDWTIALILKIMLLWMARISQKVLFDKAADFTRP